MVGFILRSFVIIVVASALGVVQGVVVRKQPLIPSADRLAAEEQWRKDVAISLDDMFKAGKSAGAIILDARPHEEFQKARLNVQMILNVMEDEVTVDLADKLRSTGLPVYIYCSSATCDLAEKVFKQIEAIGPPSEMKIYHDGWKGIEGRPELISTSPAPTPDWFESTAGVTDDDSHTAGEDPENAPGDAAPADSGDSSDQPDDDGGR